MKLSASIYSSKNHQIVDTVQQLEPLGVDFWHIDSRDNLEVFKDIIKIKSLSPIPIDLHIISENPADYYTMIESHQLDQVSFQVESLPENYNFPKFENTNIGIAILIGNPNMESIIEKYYESIDYVLLMMTTPGISGGQFDQTHFFTIRNLVSKYPNMSWCIDGGVTHEVSYILRLIGVDTIVVGSYLLGHENMAHAILNINSRKVKSDFRVIDYMIPSSSLPLISNSDTILTMLQILDEFKLGMVFVLDSTDKFIGIITNADIRKVLLDKKFSYEMDIDSFLNRTPITIKSTANTSEMIEMIELTNFPILVLPIIDKFETLIGAISFHNLLKLD